MKHSIIEFSAIYNNILLSINTKSIIILNGTCFKRTTGIIILAVIQLS